MVRHTTPFLLFLRYCYISTYDTKQPLNSRYWDCRVWLYFLWASFAWFFLHFGQYLSRLRSSYSPHSQNLDSWLSTRISPVNFLYFSVNCGSNGKTDVVKKLHGFFWNIQHSPSFLNLLPNRSTPRQLSWTRLQHSLLTRLFNVILLVILPTPQKVPAVFCIDHAADKSAVHFEVSRNLPFVIFYSQKDILAYVLGYSASLTPLQYLTIHHYS